MEGRGPRLTPSFLRSEEPSSARSSRGAYEAALLDLLRSNGDKQRLPDMHVAPTARTAQSFKTMRHTSMSSKTARPTGEGYSNPNSILIRPATAEAVMRLETEVLEKTPISERMASFSKPKMADAFGNYPLSTAERLQETILRRVDEEKRALEKQRKAEELKARFMAKQMAKEAARQEELRQKLGVDVAQGRSEASVNDGGGKGSSAMARLSGAQGKGKLKQRLLLAKAALSLKAAPPQRKARAQLRRLKLGLNRVAMKKLLFEWPTVQSGFRVPIVEMEWPTSPHAHPLPEKQTRAKGPKGTMNIEDFFRLLHETLHLSWNEQRFVADDLLNLPGAAKVHGLGARPPTMPQDAPTVYCSI